MYVCVCVFSVLLYMTDMKNLMNFFINYLVNCYFIYRFIVADAIFILDVMFIHERNMNGTGFDEFSIKKCTLVHCFRC